MYIPKIQPKHGPEFALQEEVRRFLAVREWVTMRTHGNAHQRGFPDLLCLHHVYGAKWVEIKCLEDVNGKKRASSFTPAQLTIFSKISQTDHGIWIITKANETEYYKLHHKPNWSGYVVDPRMYNKGGDPKSLLFDIAGENPEAKIQNAIMKEMRARGWVCLPTQGNLYQQGLPDFYALHPTHGAKWVEVKRREAYRFTGAQKKFFPLISQAGHGIWILTAVSEIEHVLNGKPNWWQFMYGAV